MNSEKTISNKEQQNFGMTEMAFEQMLQQLQKGDESLFEQIFLAHVADCIRFLKNKYSVQHELAYDATLDTLLTFRKRLLDGKVRYGNMRFLFTQMAGQVLLRSLKKGTVEASETLLADLPEEEGVDESLFQLLDQAWDMLGANCSQLLKAFYYQKQQLKAIAEAQNKSEAALRKQKQRCLEKLRTNFLTHYQNT